MWIVADDSLASFRDAKFLRLAQAELDHGAQIICCAIERLCRQGDPGLSLVTAIGDRPSRLRGADQIWLLSQLAIQSEAFCQSGRACHCASE